MTTLIDTHPLDGAVALQQVGEGRYTAAPWVIVRDRSGVEHYARLKTGSALSAIGRSVTLTPISNGLAQMAAGRGPISLARVGVIPASVSPVLCSQRPPDGKAGKRLHGLKDCQSIADPAADISAVSAQSRPDVGARAKVFLGDEACCWEIRST